MPVELKRLVSFVGLPFLKLNLQIEIRPQTYFLESGSDSDFVAFWTLYHKLDQIIPEKS